MVAAAEQEKGSSVAAGDMKSKAEAAVSVKRGEPTLVAPAEPTPTGGYYLSNLDQNIAVIVQTVYCFSRGALVHYHPLAGRLVVSPEMKLAVDCTGEGVVFVEADAECDLADMGDLSTTPDPAKLGLLVYSVPGAKNILQMPPITAQVTRFRCGGFSLGLAMNHCMFDGLGAMEFVNSWAEMARGATELSVPPFLDRAAVLRARDPPLISFPHREFDEIPDASALSAAGTAQEDLAYRSFRFDPARLERVRGLAQAQAQAHDTAAHYTTFEALSGLVWRARTAALGLAPEQQTKLLFAVDARRRLSPPLPRGYFGNGIVLTNALATAGELLGSPPSRSINEVAPG